MNKNLLIAALAGLCALSCATPTAAQTETEMKTEGKKLVVYFSHTGENYNVGVIETGNTRIVADMIADATGADRFEIVPEVRYPHGYDECIAVAKR